ncbi:DUF924 family protein [Phenylobacterium terrae]|uniref:DUF924 family protein n=1 Tax=Phenylobacterium terrae TaxID=2665495 RepID=A0ABW4N325_9CAUL
MAASPQDILSFWRSAGPAKWFARNPAFDQAIQLRFEPVHHAAARGEYDDWAKTADGALALLILLDQFPRNLYRGSAHAFATDPKARAIARAAVEAGFDKQVEPALRPFFYLPFEHSEDLEDQVLSCRLCKAHMDETGDAETLKWAELHREIIEKFGRFPHRNPCFGRTTTPDEQAFLDAGGFAG